MGALSEVIAATPRRGVANQRCGVAKARERMDPEDAALMDELLADTEHVSLNWLADRMAEAGYPEVSYGAIRRHRERRCRTCPLGEDA